MDLSIHNVEDISVKATYLELSKGTVKVIKIKINGWDNCINLYCNDDIKIDVSEAVFRQHHRRNE